MVANAKFRGKGKLYIIKLCIRLGPFIKPKGNIIRLICAFVFGTFLGWILGGCTPSPRSKNTPGDAETG